MKSAKKLPKYGPVTTNAQRVFVVAGTLRCGVDCTLTNRLGITDKDAAQIARKASVVNKRVVYWARGGAGFVFSYDPPRRTN